MPVANEFKNVIALMPAVPRESLESEPLCPMRLWRLAMGGFEPLESEWVLVAQLDRALPSEGKGCAFKSRRGRFQKHRAGGSKLGLQEKIEM